MQHDEAAMLLRRCARGDRTAFRQLYDAEADALHGVARRITGNRALAADALHDAMLQAWRNAAQFNPERGSGWTWLVSLVRYRAIDLASRAGRETLTSDPPDMPDTQPDPYEALAQTREERRLRHCLETLESRPRRLVTLAFLEGLTHAQVAARTGEPLGTVKSLIRRTLLRLRGCMDGSG